MVGSSVSVMFDIRPEVLDGWSVPRHVHGAWLLGDTVAVAMDARPRSGLPSPWLALLGRPEEAAELARAVPALLGRDPGGLTVSADVFPVVSAVWDLRLRGRWEYMATGDAPPMPEPHVREVLDPAEVDAVLDAGNADAHARPGDPDILRWLGIDDAEGLACVGALTRTVNGGAHLRAITTVPHARGRGLGTAVSAALTRAGLAEVSPEVTLGVYTVNTGAIALYERLGYRRVHSLVSALRIR